MVPTLPPSRAFACARSGRRLRGLGLYRPRQLPSLAPRALWLPFPPWGELGLFRRSPSQSQAWKNNSKKLWLGLRFSEKRQTLKFGLGLQAPVPILGWGRGCHNSVRFKGACARGVARALIERPLSTGGRGCVSPARGGCVGMARARVEGGGAQAACARGACGWGRGRAGGGVSPRLARSLAGWRAPPLPSRAGNPGRVVAAAAYVSALSQRGRAGRPGGRERSLGGRAAGAERGGGPRRVGGQGPRQLQPRAKPSCPSGSCPARAAACGGAR